MALSRLRCSRLNLAALAIVFLGFACQSHIAPTTTTPSPLPVAAPTGTHLPQAPPTSIPVSLDQVITAHAVDPRLIASVSKFRSMIGHGMHWAPEWSPKHYFVPIPSIAYADRGVPVYSPVDGQVWRVLDEKPRPRGDMSNGGVAEHSGQQPQIKVAGHESVNVVLFHIDLLDGISEGSTVRAGQHIGYANTKGNSFDIAIELWDAGGGTYTSYFELLPDRLFEDYRRLGIATRAGLLISEEYRRAHPFAFNSPEALAEGWVRLDHGQR